MMGICIKHHRQGVPEWQSGEMWYKPWEVATIHWQSRASRIQGNPTQLATSSPAFHKSASSQKQQGSGPCHIGTGYLSFSKEIFPPALHPLVGQRWQQRHKNLPPPGPFQGAATLQM